MMSNVFRRATLACVICCTFALTLPMSARASDPGVQPRKKVALLVADWFKGSHPDVLFTRLFETYTRDGNGLKSSLEITSCYRDLPTKNDLSAEYAAANHFEISKTVEDALTLGTGKLAVDGVLISTEWAPYPESDTGQFVYPHRRLFEACVKVFKESGRVVPVFIDKHLADTWEDSKWIYDTAKELKIPLMAGSSVPLCIPEADAKIERGAKLKEIVGVSYGTLTTYGFHGLEMTLALGENRKNADNSVKRVTCLTGDAIWKAAGRDYDPELLAAALEKVAVPIPAGKALADVAIEPALFVIDHADGLRVNLFTLNGASLGWSAAWRYKDGRKAATMMASEWKPERLRFDWQMHGVEEMVLTGKPAWPVERTLLSSGLLDAALISKRDGGKVVDTPHLKIPYQVDAEWKPPEALKGKKNWK